MARQPGTALGGLTYQVKSRSSGGLVLFEDSADCAAFKRVLAEARPRG